MGIIRNSLHAANMVGSVLRNPPYTSSGHFYSPLTNPDDVERALRLPAILDLVDLQTDSQEELLTEIAPMWADFESGPRWSDGPENNQYGLADAAVYCSMLRRHAPSRVVEVGSGYSSAIALDTRQRHGLAVELTFIEPYTDRLDRLISPADRASTTVRREFVQDTPAEVFDGLESGDMLFIDSSHVLKAGSDVEHLLFRVLPSLPTDILVHFHDCFWPWQYPEAWLRQRRDWNELYFICAFLAGNDAWEIVLFSDWVWQTHQNLVGEHLPGSNGQRPGGLWIRKVR